MDEPTTTGLLTPSKFSRVCSNRGGLIRKYGVWNNSLRCWNDFFWKVKVSWLTGIFHYRWTSADSASVRSPRTSVSTRLVSFLITFEWHRCRICGTQKLTGVFFFQPTTVPLRYEPGTPLSPFFLFAFSRPIRLHDMYFPISRCSALGEAKKSTWEEKRIPN